ncbi:hypothetical protein [Nonomuraea sp. NPDC049129]|uniref:hypothetical protein n=1 Tax=Nonomuraea sp. NPDC049129 TaxID=3155272 RepID=UPI0033F7A28E
MAAAAGPVKAAKAVRPAAGVVKAAAEPVARPGVVVAGAVRPGVVTVVRVRAAGRPVKVVAGAVRAGVVAVAGAGRGVPRVTRRAMPPSTSCGPSTSVTRTPTC